MKDINIHMLRKSAKKRLPGPLFHYIEGGADDEWSLGNNTSAFENYELAPRYLVNVEDVDTRKTILGCDLDVPFFLSPTGGTRLFHHDKEIAVAKAAAAANTLYCLSTMGTTRLEEVADISSGPKMFQLYIHKDRGLTTEFIERCKSSGYDALCLTVDTPQAGNRERDLMTGMSVPPSLTFRSLISFLSHPFWLYHFIRDPNIEIANVVHRVDGFADGPGNVMDYVNDQFDRTVTWKDAERMIQLWDGPFVIKGLQTAEDARRARDIGASAIMISNHGGRQLEGTPAPVDCIRPIRDAVDNDLELIVDGGIRRGTHIIKALALGADACSIGRPYLYGLASAGQQGVTTAIDILRTELERSMTLLGCQNVDDIDERCLFTGVEGLGPPLQRRSSEAT